MEGLMTKYALSSDPVVVFGGLFIFVVLVALYYRVKGDKYG
jgi:hypothetical protein